MKAGRRLLILKLRHGKVQSSSLGGRAFGRSTLDLRLSQIVVNGQPVPITTSGYQQASQASIAKAAKGAAAGGAIAGNAGTGAAIGTTAGALVRGQTFSLAQPVTLQ